MFGDPAPVNQSLPLLGGEAVVGRTLMCTTGAWTGASTFAFAWLRNGAAIAGATAAGYVVTAGDVGQEVRCQVTARNDTGPGVARSAPVVPVAGPAGPPPPAAAPPVKQPAAATVKVTCKPKARTKSKRARVSVTCTVRPLATAGQLRITRNGKRVGTATLKKGRGTVKLRRGQYKLTLVRNKKVIARASFRVR